MTEIVKLQSQVRGLTEVVEHLFALTKSVQRYTDEQETAVKEIPGILEHIRNPDG